MPGFVVSFIYLLVELAVLGLIYWVFLQFPLPEPIPRIARVIFTVICAIILIVWLLGLIGVMQFPGSTPIFRRP